MKRAYAFDGDDNLMSVPVPDNSGATLRYRGRVLGINTDGHEMPNVERTFMSLREAMEWIDEQN